MKKSSGSSGMFRQKGKSKSELQHRKEAIEVQIGRGATIFREETPDGAQASGSHNLLKADVQPTEPYKSIRTLSAPDENATWPGYGRLVAGQFLDMLYMWENDIPEDFPSKLKASLSKTLSHFPTLTGRLNPRNHWVQKRKFKKCSFQFFSSEFIKFAVIFYVFHKKCFFST